MDNNTIPIGQFKAKCLRLMNEVSEGKRSTFTVTKHGKPLVKVVPTIAPKKKKMPKAGFMKGSVKIIGDIVSPMHDVWNLSEWNFPE